MIKRIFFTFNDKDCIRSEVKRIPDTIGWTKPRFDSYGDSIEQIRSFEHLISTVLWQLNKILATILLVSLIRDGILIVSIRRWTPLLQKVGTTRSEKIKISVSFWNRSPVDISSSPNDTFLQGGHPPYGDILSARLTKQAGRISFWIHFPFPQWGQTLGSIPVIRVSRSSQDSFGTSSGSFSVPTPRSLLHRKSFPFRLRWLKIP